MTIKVDEGKVIKASFLFVVLFSIIIGFLKLATPLLIVLFSVLILNLFHRIVRKSIAIVIFLILVSLIIYASIFFSKEFINTLPKIAEESIPRIIDFAGQYGFDLPFTDLESLKGELIKGAKQETAILAKVASTATREFVYLIIGIVVAVALFINRSLDLDRGNYRIEHNVYSTFCDQLSNRFRAFYNAFEVVLGAQLMISLINTFFTGIFVVSVGLPYAKTVIIITFMCGLLPIIGNLISNTIIFSIGLTVSSKLAIAALIFLIALHKLEYFLNSKIIGGRIRNPMWLTLLSLLLGESIMGIPGIILAPVVLSYLKAEFSQMEAIKL